MSPIISVIITAIIVAPITWVVAVAYRKNSYESKIGSAEEKSREDSAKRSNQARATPNTSTPSGAWGTSFAHSDVRA